jgi:HEAT repeat protein
VQLVEIPEIDKMMMIGVPLSHEVVLANQAEVAIPLLLESLKDQRSGPKRTNSIKLMGLFAWRARVAIPALIAALDDSDPIVRLAAIQVLGRVSRTDKVRDPMPIPELPQVIEALTNHLNDEGVGSVSGQKNRVFIASELGNVGATSAVPKLVELLGDEDQAMRRTACSSLGEIKGPGAVEALPAIDQLAASDPSADVRKSAEAAAKELRKK